MLVDNISLANPPGMMIVSARNNFDGTSGFELVNREIAFYGFGAVARAVHKLAQGGNNDMYTYHVHVSCIHVYIYIHIHIYIYIYIYIYIKHD